MFKMEDRIREYVSTTTGKVVKAVQWTGDTHALEAIASLGCGVLEASNGLDLHIDTPSGLTHRMRPNDWLFVKNGNMMFIFVDYTFKRVFKLKE